MNKQVITTVVLILLAAAAFTWWDASRKAERNQAPSQSAGSAKWEPVAISEPPISEQIEAQIKSIETGKTVPLPIPLYIAGEKIDRLDVDWLREKLKALGYKETEVATELSENTETEYAYTNPSYREILLLSSTELESSEGPGGTIVMGFDKNSGEVKENPELRAVSKRAGEAFGMYVGHLHIGISWSEVERELVNLPAWTMKMDSSSATMLQRGKYMYTFVSVAGKLHTITILSTNYEHWGKMKGFSDERRRKFITSMFENDFDINIESEMEKYR